MREAPTLEGDALRAVQHRGSHMQIIASAGSGKTEVVSQRVADLLAEGVQPDAIVAFTFTERAAAELKERIEARVMARLGSEALDRLNGLFVGTIHAWCTNAARNCRLQDFNRRRHHAVRVTAPGICRRWPTRRPGHPRNLPPRSNGTRSAVAVDGDNIRSAEEVVGDAAARIRSRDFAPSPGTRCRTCEVRTIYSARA